MDAGFLRRPITWAIVAALAVAGVVAATAVAFVREYEGGAVETTGLTVTGEGAVRAVPDTATVHVGANATAPAVGEARQRVSGHIDALTAALTSQFGIAKEDIATQQLNIYPVYDYSKGPQGPVPPSIAGYRVEHVLTVRTRKVDAVGEIVDKAVEVVGSDIVLQGTFFTIEDVAKLQEEARKEAYENARKAAEQLAVAADARLGKALTISEVTAAQSLPFPAGAQIGGRGGDSGGGFIPPGQQDLSVVLQVTFALK